MDVLLPQSGGRKWNASLLISSAVHGIFLLGIVFVYHHAPQFIKTSLIARGEGGSVTLLYSPSAPAVPKAKVRSKQDALTFVKDTPQFAPRHTGSRTPEKENKARPVEEETTSARAGSPYGSMYSGNTFGTDVRPAIPSIFPDPPVIRSEVPSGVEGDVEVELTIEETGNVTATRLLKGMGYGIDEKVIATLRSWRFRPATRDGSPIPSKQDYKHHFPS